MIEQDVEKAIPWVEATVSGKVISRRRQLRWRPHWFLDVAVGSGEVKKVLLRGLRIPGGHMSPTVEHAKSLLQTDAEVLKYLQGIPVKSAKYYGFNEELGWMLMEAVEGDYEITALQDRNLQRSLMREYLADVAIVHSQPLSSLPKFTHIHPPANIQEYIRGEIDATKRRLIEETRLVPEPIFRLGLGWLIDHPIGDRPIGLSLIDVGPNQFLFRDGHYVAPFDFEVALICDPLFDIAELRMRQLAYSIGGVSDSIKFYSSEYERLTGIPVDIDALHYWTVFGQTCFGLWWNRGAQFPLAAELDSTFILAWEVQQRRCVVEALADWCRVELEPPVFPEPRSTVMTTACDLMVDQFDKYYAKSGEAWNANIFAKYSGGLARTLQKANTFGPLIYQQNLDELGELLGKRVVDWRAGLGDLDALIESDYEKDMEKRLKFFHRSTLRQEFLYEPMQLATGVSSRTPLERLYK